MNQLKTLALGKESFVNSGFELKSGFFWSGVMNRHGSVGDCNDW